MPFKPAKTSAQGTISRRAADRSSSRSESPAESVSPPPRNDPSWFEPLITAPDEPEEEQGHAEVAEAGEGETLISSSMSSSSPDLFQQFVQSPVNEADNLISTIVDALRTGGGSGRHTNAGALTTTPHTPHTSHSVHPLFRADTASFLASPRRNTPQVILGPLLSIPDVSSLPSTSTSVSMDTATLALRRGVIQMSAPSPSASLDGMVLGSIPAPLSLPSDPISNAFPSAANRRLFHQFFNMTSSIVVAMGNRANSSNQSKNPFLAVSLPLILLDVDSPARAAFRLGVLSLGAAHLHHSYMGSSAEHSQQMLVETTSAKRQAGAHMILSLSKEGDKHVDLLLATCMAVKTRDVLMADKSWKQNLDFAIRMMYKRGGPAALLAEDPSNFGRRFVIEQLTTTDVFSTFTTGEEPLLLGEHAPWWFEFNKTAVSDWQWEAYERQFGMSREMLELVARCRVIVYRKVRLGTAFPCDSGTENIGDTIDQDAYAMIEQLKLWSITQLNVPQKSRVLIGDSAYRYAMMIMLYTEVLNLPASDERIQTAVHCVLELCSEISMEPVMLVWPLLIAGACATASDRQWIRDLFNIFKDEYCSDLSAGQKLLTEQWLRIDDGRGFTLWPQLMKEIDLQVLLI
ncbi:hypothetical protein Q8F55_005404 [Vanrija albida]|uniref:Uncharacterized protein n=1 Tax=Vanrija albida TaxID=181172 RepID=A0ABR3Q1R5_9TREE